MITSRRGRGWQRAAAASLGLLLAAGCSDHGSSSGGGAVDAGVNAEGECIEGAQIASPDGPAGPVSITALTLTGNGQPQAGARALFYDRDGALVADQTTPADGTASADLPPGGTAVVVWTQSSGVHIDAILGVEPGDDLVMGHRASPPGLPIGTVTANLPATDGAQDYAVSGGCADSGFRVPDGGQVSLKVTFYGGSCDPDTYDYLAVATGADHRPLAYAELLDQPLVDGQTLPAFSDWHPVGSFTARFTSVPAGAIPLSVTAVPTMDGILFGSGVGADIVPDGKSQVSFALPRFGDGLYLATEVATTSTAFSQTVYTRAPGGLNDSIELGPLLLPWVTAPSVPGSRCIALSQQGSGTADGEVVLMHPAAARDHDQVAWEILAPPGTTRIVLPHLPDDLAAYELAPGETGASKLWLIESSDFDDYAGFRAGMMADYGSYVDHKVLSGTRYQAEHTVVSGTPIEN